MSRIIAVALGLVLAAPCLPALAQTKAAAPATPAAQTFTPNHLALAREVMLSSGIARSFDSIIPSFADQIRKQAVTRPEIQKDLDEVLVQIQPEMELQKQRMINIAARTYAAKLSEAELTDIANFFRSPAGKRYVETSRRSSTKWSTRCRVGPKRCPNTSWSASGPRWASAATTSSDPWLSHVSPTRRVARRSR